MRRVRTVSVAFVVVVAGALAPAIAAAKAPTLELVQNGASVLIGEQMQVEPNFVTLSTTTTGSIKCQSVNGMSFAGKDISNDSATDRIEVISPQGIIGGEHPCESNSSIGKTVFVAFGQQSAGVGELTVSAKGKAEMVFKPGALFEAYFSEQGERCAYTLKTLKGSLEDLNKTASNEALKLEFKEVKLKLASGSGPECSTKAALKVTNERLKTANNYWHGFTE